jgi:anthranilate synthase/indole-3-glycerol phosphate synthase/phosphoribosylanthranilate isomerase
MGKTFGKVNVCLVGDFGTKAEKVKQWVEANGGKLSKHVDSDVTHLITTKDAFRKPVADGTVNLSSKLALHH